MITASAELSAALITLAERCWDGEIGFHAAAAGIEDPPLRRLCESYADQRAGFRRELLRELASLGVNPGSAGLAAETSAGDPTWSAGPDEVVAVGELARRDGAAEAAYRDLLMRGLPGGAAETVERQHHELEDALKHLSLLERSLAPTR
jgi:hypothetical protein